MGKLLVHIGGNGIYAWELGASTPSLSLKDLGSFQADGDIFDGENFKKAGWFIESLSEDIDKSSHLIIIVSDVELYIRRVDFPFKDADKARLAAPSVLAATLPFDGPFLFDLLPLVSNGGHSHYIAVCSSKKDMDRYLSLFTERDIEVDHVIPALLVSFPPASPGEEDTYSHGYLDEEIGCISDCGWGKSGNIRFLSPGKVKEECSQDGLKLRQILDLSRVPGNLPPGLNVSTSLNEKSLERFFADREAQKFNLLALREMGKKDVASAKANKFLIIASAAIFFLSLILCIEGARYFTHKKSTLVRKAMETRFREAIKGGAMVDPVAQIKTRIDTLEDEVALFPGRKGPFSSILYSLSSEIKPEHNITINEISFSRGKATLSGEAPGQERLSRVKESLTRKFGSEVEITETGPSTVKGRIKFTLTVSKEVL